MGLQHEPEQQLLRYCDTKAEMCIRDRVYFQTADLFAWTVTIVAVSVVFERLFLALVDRLMGKAGL